MKAETKSRTPVTKPISRKSTASVSPIASTKPSKAPQMRPRPAASDPTERQRLIAEAAYFRAERRGFVPGHEETDWLEAEKEFDMAAAGH